MTEEKHSKDKREPIILDGFPMELNPELFKPHIDFEEEERLLKEEERQKRKDKIQKFFKRK